MAFLVHEIPRGEHAERTRLVARRRELRLRERHAAKDREGAVAAVGDAFVDAIDFMGTPDEVRDFGRAYVDAGVDVPILMPLPWGPDRRQVIDDTMRAFVS